MGALDMAGQRKIEWGYSWELKEEEKEIVRSQVKDIKLFETDILIETSEEGERYTEGSTYDLGELAGHFNTFFSVFLSV